MSTSSSGDSAWADRWDQMFDALSAEPRREIIISLRDVPRERRLRLPEAAASPNQSLDSKTSAIELRHHHLPMLADAGYAHLERRPFCVQRGPHFAEPALIIENIFESPEEIPESLINNCKILQEMVDR